MREIRLSDQATKILRKLTSSEFDINLIKSLCSDVKVNLYGKWEYSENKQLNEKLPFFESVNELGFLIINDDSRLISEDALSDDILGALRKYRQLEEGRKNLIYFKK